MLPIFVTSEGEREGSRSWEIGGVEELKKHKE